MCALWGNGYVRIFRDKRYRPVRLKFIHPARIEPLLTDNDELFYPSKIRTLTMAATNTSYK